MKMIVMISQIEEELGASIEIQEASLLITIRDFVNKVREVKGLAPVADQKDAVACAADSSASGKERSEESVSDEVAQAVIACAAEAYGVDASKITLGTDIREELSNESMKMIVMISQIEEELGVSIEIQEASLLMTIQDFVDKVRERL